MLHAKNKTDNQKSQKMAEKSIESKIEKTKNGFVSESYTVPFKFCVHTLRVSTKVKRNRLAAIS